MAELSGDSCEICGRLEASCNRALGPNSEAECYKLGWQRESAVRAQFAEDISRLAQWHPHSAVGALRLIRREYECKRARVALADALERLAGFQCDEGCGEFWNKCKCPDGRWYRRAQAALEDSKQYE